MAHAKNHDYHILPPSINPLLAAIGAFVMLSGSVVWMHDGGPWMALIGLALVLYVMFAWWSDVVEESQVGTTPRLCGSACATASSSSLCPK